MNPIGQIVFNALARKKAVSFPGWGTLYVRSVPVSIEGDRIHVPVHTVHFTGDDSRGTALYSLVCDSIPMDRNELDRKVARWIERLKTKEGDSFFIEGVAEIVCRGGNYTVIPSNDLNNLLNPFEQWVYPLPQVRDPEKIPEIKPVIVLPERPKPSRNRTSGRPWWIVIGLTVGLLVAVGYVYYRHAGKSPLSGIETTPVSPITVVEPIHRTERAEPPVYPMDELPPVSVDSMGELPVIETDTAKTPAVDFARGEEHSSVAYHVIGGVFSNRENALRYIDQNKFGPQEPLILPTSAGRFMVSIARFADKKDADRTVRELSRNYPELWVQKREE